MRDVLQARPKEHYEYLSQLLGLGLLEIFEAQAKERAEDLAKMARSALDDEERETGQRDAAAARLMTSEQRAAARKPVEAARDELAKLLEAKRDLIKVSDKDLNSSSSLALLSSQTSSLARELQLAASELASLEGRLEDLGPTDATALEEARAGVLERTTQRDVAIQELARVRESERLARSESDQLSQLASLAIPLLSEHCPVCTQTISAERVAEDLKTRAANMESLLAARARTRDAERLLQEREQALGRAEQPLVRLESDARTREDLERSVRRNERKAIKRVDGFRRLRIVRSAVDQVKPSMLPALADVLQSVSDATRELSVLLRLAEESEGTGQLRVAVRELNSSVEERQHRTRRLSEKHEQAKRLFEDTREARLKVIERRFQRLQPLVADIYRRLDPHPTFRDI